MPRSEERGRMAACSEAEAHSLLVYKEPRLEGRGSLLSFRYLSPNRMSVCHSMKSRGYPLRSRCYDLLRYKGRREKLDAILVFSACGTFGPQRRGFTGRPGSQYVGRRERNGYPLESFLKELGERSVP